MIGSQFRTDINGLRAYAVVFVVLFHFNVFGFSAGYLGVDVFFVISGYLMTKIIVEKLEHNNFSFVDFYLSRIIRIYPALLFLVLVLTALGLFVFIPEDLQNFAKDARYSLTFLSNNLFYEQSGDYFATSSHDKALLHTWSLAVEWQFYILFPIILYTFKKLTKQTKYIGILLLILFACSFLLSVKLTPENPIYAFFKLSTRAWELIAGGLVYFYFNQYSLSSIKQKIIEYTGFVLLALSLIFLTKDTPWPGYAASLPVLGTVLILIANRQNSILTKPKFIQSLGSASYSIYLWHWPISFLLSYFLIQKNIINISFALLLSFVLGWLSYKYIEPCRIHLNKINKKYVYLLFILSIAILYPFYKFLGKDGLENRADAEYLKSIEKIQMPMVSNGWCFYNIKDDHSLTVGENGLKCHIASNSTNAKSALFFGDSFAGHNIPFWDRLGKKLNLNIHTISTNWCYPSLDKEFTGDKSSTAYQQCLINRNYLKNHIAQYDVLIFAGRWTDIVRQNQQNSFSELLKVAQMNNKKVIVMSEPYTFDQNISSIFKRAIWLERDFNLNEYMNNPLATKQKYATSVINKIVSEHPNTLLLSQVDLFKSDHMATKNTPYSFDGRHISIVGSLASEQYFETRPKFKVLENFIAKQ
ncbi:acyltransferase family protein [Acinetobacter junii]|uniref:acyltransferase family protein n=1 Tax=Acinetobacter junii TaxID=40215 RepID=UPI00143C7D08|nr:acyltransferase family protein [Acinetobacter junii]NKG34594.1 acyltransferase [Acinetobacter junii]